jgi:cyclic-di-GMP phosphodiesterase, flagellum assembly factor TipF
VYSAAAAALAIAADWYGSASAMVIGPVVFGVALGVHFGIANRRRVRWLERRLKDLGRELEDTRRDLEDQRVLVDGMLDRLNDMPDAERLSSELKVLHGLLRQFSEKKEAAVRSDSTGKTKVAALPSSDRKQASTRVVTMDGAELLEAIEGALREEKVELFLQPVVSLPQRKRRFYECFSRIRADGDGVITPEQYLPVAEQAGLVAAIDNLLLVRCVQLVRRARRDHLDVGFFCNISNASLTDTDFFQEFIEFMAANRDLCEELIFEFDQASVSSEDYVTRMNLKRLQGYGYKFSMDQVSDLNLNLDDLANQGFRYIKVNAHLLHEMARGDDPILDMRAFKGALDRHAMDLIVEKIESEDMLLDLLDLRVDFGQGYLFGEPRPTGGRR